MAYIKKRGNKLYVRYSILGVEKTKSTGLVDNTENREFITKSIIPTLEKKIVKGDYSKNDLVSVFAEKYLKEKDNLKTYFEYATRVQNYIINVFGSRPIQDITLDEIKDWVDSFSCSTKTLKKYVGDFKTIYQIAIEHEVIESNIFKKIRLPKHTKKEISPFSKEDVQAILNDTSGDLNNFFGIAFLTGMRAGEIIALQEQDIDFDRGIISIRRNITKGNLTTPKTSLSIRQVPILNECVPYLKKQILISKERKSLFLFCRQDGQRLSDSNGLNALRYLKLRGYNHRVHDTRHTFITNMLNSGIIRITDLAQIVGHANTQMIMTTYARYIKGEHLQIDRNHSIYGGSESTEVQPNSTGVQCGGT